eukprot:COSAG02_NODE_45930_length_353_cov_0.551181_1_plen_49_part_01
MITGSLGTISSLSDIVLAARQCTEDGAIITARSRRRIVIAGIARMRLAA